MLITTELNQSSLILRRGLQTVLWTGCVNSDGKSNPIRWFKRLYTSNRRYISPVNFAPAQNNNAATEGANRTLVGPKQRHNFISVTP